MGAKQDRRAW